MSRFTPSLRHCLQAAVAGLAALVAPAALRAQSTTAPKVFHACYVPSSGSVYRIKEVDLKQECVKSTHIQFSWTDGAGALTQVVTVRSAYKDVAAHQYGSIDAICPAGTQLTGGGYEIIYFPNNVVAPVIWFSKPRDDRTGWSVGFQNTSDNLAEFVTYVHCAK